MIFFPGMVACLLFVGLHNIIVFKHLFVGLDSQRLAGKLAHLKLEINPMILTAPSPVSHFPVLYLLRNNRIKIFRLIVYAVASEAHSIL